MTWFSSTAWSVIADLCYTAPPCPGGSGLCTSCERVQFFLAFLDPQTQRQEDTDVHESGCRILPTQPHMGPGYVLQRAVKQSRRDQDVRQTSKRCY